MKTIVTCAKMRAADKYTIEQLGVPAQELMERAGAAIAADVLFFFLFACTYAAAAALFRLPSFRLYMGAAALAGFFLYLESLHRILAFLAKRLYNTVRSGRKKIAVGVRRWKKTKKSAS